MPEPSRLLFQSIFFAVGICPPRAALGVVPSNSSGERTSIIVTFPIYSFNSSNPIMIEGLIVYIQSLRLHLYEFFTKWYDGGAQPFRQVVPEMLYNQFKWNRK